jgi:hypothetical protein
VFGFAEILAREVLPSGGLLADEGVERERNPSGGPGYDAASAGVGVFVEDPSVIVRGRPAMRIAADFEKSPGRNPAIPAGWLGNSLSCGVRQSLRSNTARLWVAETPVKMWSLERPGAAKLQTSSQ